MNVWDDTLCGSPVSSVLRGVTLRRNAAWALRALPCALLAAVLAAACVAAVQTVEPSGSDGENLRDWVATLESDDAIEISANDSEFLAGESGVPGTIFV